ncbi:MAG: hypothetical protein JWM25_654 [Thermoleophilia bacterium]|nr:hypothetical protein [Thermoleophilia bacterium]MCZ4496071.1 hypothetical protein [Thermoleophilia bacterium]
MRRFLFIAVISALLVGCFAGVASARLAASDDGRPARAPFAVPATAPSIDAAQPGAYGFQASSKIAAALQATSRQATQTATPEAAGASITITAVVLPTVTVVLDEAGVVVEIITNTPDRSATGAMYLFRRGTDTGPAVELDAATWRSARHALARTAAGTGTIYTR